MVYGNIIIILLIYTIEPYLWIKSMSVLPRRFENNRYYEVAGIGYYLITLMKQYATFSQVESIVINILTIVMSIYVLFITVYFFQERLYKKLLSIGVFCFLVTLTEVIVMTITVYFVKVPLREVMLFNGANTICTLIAKLMLFPLFHIFYFRDIRRMIDSVFKRREIVSVAIVSSLFIVPMTAIIRNSRISENDEVISIFAMAQILILVNSIYIIFVLARKDTKLNNAEKEIHQLKDIMEITTRLKQLEHDMNTHATIISNLVQSKCYDELEDYIENTFQDIEVARNVCTLSDHAVASVISNLIVKATERNIKFSRHIMLDNFFIPSKDVCGIVSNMVNNAIEATEGLIEEKRYVSLDIFPTEGGYNITCMNPYEKKADYFITTKQDKEKHGFGLGIIKSIAEKHGGVMQIVPNDINWFEITCFIPTPSLEQSAGGTLE